MAGYPTRWEADVVLADGATMHVRPIRPDDAGRIEALHQRLSPETIYFRFFTPLPHLSSTMLARFVNVDYVERLALVGELGEDIIAVARYERLPTTWEGRPEAEVAFLVDDAHQGRGIGTVMLEHLAGAAKEAGIGRFVADTLADNRRMLGVFHDAGYGDERRFADGVIRVGFDITATEASEAARDDRERRSVARSIRRLLAPTSVAVIGASRHRDTLGHLLFSTILAAGFEGPVYPVNPAADHVAGVRAYRSVIDVPDRVDLAVIVVPTAAVAAVVDECARKRVGGLVVVSSGFAELDARGRAAERAVVATARRNGMRVIGPNGMGVVNTDPAVRLDATFSPMPPLGRVGMVAQSGALGAVLLEELTRRRLGVSTFVSAGNKADVSGNDLLQYWEDDDATDVVLMYIESFGNPRTFARVARRLSLEKPIVAVKSSRSPAGWRAAGAHRTLQDDDAVDALFRRAGVIRTDTLEELFDVTQLLAAQPLPAGPRVAVVGHSGGSGVLAADACSAAGLELPTLSQQTQQRLRDLLGARAPVANPVDLGPEVTPTELAEALGIVLDDPEIDAGLMLYATALAAPVPDVALAVAGAGHAAGKPVLACILGRREQLDTGPELSPLPSYAFPEAAAHALGRVVNYAAWRARARQSGTDDPLADLGPDEKAEARRLVDRALGIDRSEIAAIATPEPPAAPRPDGSWMAPLDGAELLRLAGIAVVDAVAVSSESEARAALISLGTPVGVRREDPPGSPEPARPQVRLGLTTADAAGAAYTSLTAVGSGPGRPSAVMVEAMAPPGDDVTVSMRVTPMFGPLLTVTAPASGPAARSDRWSDGRVAATAQLPPRAVSLPLDATEAATVVDEALGRHSPDAGRAGLADLVMRLGALVAAIPELAELRLDPVIVGRDGPVVAGWALRVAPWEARPELALRRLR